MDKKNEKQNRSYLDLVGHRILILGAKSDECLIVQTAKTMGIYTIVTDNHENWEDAPAKYIADEAWDISWNDIEALKSRAKSSKVDGVIAGYSEFRLNAAIKLSRELGTHFYIRDEEQLRITRDKLLFKDICRKYGVPVADDYFVTSEIKREDLEKIVYPVIVKPADSGGSQGIRYCKGPEDIRKCIEYALMFSESKRVVVEEVLEGHEVVAYFTVADGEIVFSSMFDKYERKEREGFNALMDVYFYPSNRVELFKEKYKDNVIQMFRHMELKNGVISLQGFYQPNGEIKFFELGYRIGGTNAYIYTEHYNDVSFLKMLISYSLTGNMHAEELVKEDPSFKGKIGCTFSIVAKDGEIGEQYGLEIVQAMPQVLYANFYHRVGSIIINNGSQLSKAFRAYIAVDSLEEAKSVIHKIQDSIVINDINGNDMRFDLFDVNRLSLNY